MALKPTAYGSGLSPQQEAFRKQNINQAVMNYRLSPEGGGWGVYRPEVYQQRALDWQARQNAARTSGSGGGGSGGGGWGGAPSGGGGGGGGGQTVPAYDPVAAAVAAKKAEEDAKRSRLRKEGESYLDKLLREYNEILKEIERATSDQTGRINKEYDIKIQGQVDDMNLGMYDVDASAAAANLADSSFRSFDRGKVRKVADENIATLNNARQGDLSEIGSMYERETARYKGERAGIDRTRKLLGEEEDLGALQNTVNSLDKTYRGMGAEKARFGTQGEFVTAANKLGNYDTTHLEAALNAVVSNSSATPSTKQAAIKDIISGSGVDKKTGKKLENKYIQVI